MIDFSKFKTELGVSKTNLMKQITQLLGSGDLELPEGSDFEFLSKCMVDTFCKQYDKNGDSLLSKCESSLVEDDTKKDYKEKISKEDFLKLNFPGLDKKDLEDLFDYLDVNENGEITQEDIDLLTNRALENFKSQNDRRLGRTVNTANMANNAARRNMSASNAGNASNTGSMQSTGNTVNNTNATQSGTKAGGGGGSREPQEQPLSNMSMEQLNTKLGEANADLATKKEALGTVTSKSDEAITDSETAMNKAFETYEEEVRKVDVEMKMANKLQELKGNINTKEGEIRSKESAISSKDQEIANQELTISTAETSYGNAITTRVTLETSLSKLESADTEKLNDEQKADRTSDISELKGKIEDAKTAEETAKTAFEEAKNKLTELENEIKTLKGELEDLNKEMDVLEKDMADLEDAISKAHPEVEKFRQAYDAAKVAYEKAKADKITNIDKAQAEVQTAQNKVNEIQIAINNFQNRQTAREYAPSGLNSAYTLDNINYNAVLPEGFASIEEFVNLMKALEIRNMGPKGDGHCFNFSQAYLGLIVGDPGVNMNGPNPTFDLRDSKYNSRPAAPVRANNMQEAFDMIQEQLDKGIPVVARIYSHSTSETHYGTIVGYRDGATPPLKETDFLIIDSYDAKLEQLGDKRHLNGYRDSVYIYTPGFTYSHKLYG